VNAAKVYQQAKNEYENQQVLLKALSEKLQLIGINPTGLTVAGISRKVAIHSPINGFVSKVNVNIGKYVNPTDVLFELINPEDLHASLTVFEKDMPMVHEGQKVKVSFVDDPDKWYDCETILVTRNVDESRAGMVHCHFETRPRKLLPGMFLNAVIETGNQLVTAVPEAAVLRYGNADYVFEELAHGQFKLVQVATGSRDGGWIELKDWSEADSLRYIVAQNGYSLLGMLKNAEE
jgi:cobalt-zinc-cadmium efflux system membrane fusion protein